MSCLYSGGEDARGSLHQQGSTLQCLIIRSAGSVIALMYFTSNPLRKHNTVRSSRTGADFSIYAERAAKD
eukprot:694843-Amphidinium_carterae.1